MKRSLIDQAIEACELEIAHQQRVLEHLKAVRGEKPKRERKVKPAAGVTESSRELASVGGNR